MYRVNIDQGSRTAGRSSHGQSGFGQTLHGEAIGVAPIAADSGEKIGERHIRGGRGYVRRALYMAALTAVRSDPGLKADYQAMRAAGKPAKVALIATARKLVVAANAMLRHGQPWSTRHQRS